MESLAQTVIIANMSLAENRKAHFNYEILERFDAGIELFGFEVTAIKKSQISLEGSYVTVRGGEAFLISASVTPIQPKNVPADYELDRNRKLLLTKKEIALLAAAETKNGLTIVPISVYNKGRHIKVEIAIVKGKKSYDKRESIKRRESDRDMQRTLKGE